MKKIYIACFLTALVGKTIPQAASQPAPFDKGALMPSLCKGGKVGEAEQGGLCVAASEIKTPVGQLCRYSFCQSLSPLRGQLPFAKGAIYVATQPAPFDEGALKPSLLRSQLPFKKGAFD